MIPVSVYIYDQHSCRGKADKARGIVMCRDAARAGRRFRFHIYKTVLIFQLADSYDIRRKIPHFQFLTDQLLLVLRQGGQILNDADFLSGFPVFFYLAYGQIACRLRKRKCSLNHDPRICFFSDRKGKKSALRLCKAKRLARKIIHFCNFFHSRYFSSNPLIFSASFWIW